MVQALEAEDNHIVQLFGSSSMRRITFNVAEIQIQGLLQLFCTSSDLDTRAYKEIGDHSIGIRQCS
ncbi:hypothetical protein KY284_013819 [Solanum tuberosum]|nr:hypothetical protein KY284_013819 [Solanum tuberosum]